MKMSSIEVKERGEKTPPKRDFVHLHLHTTYSLLDGAQLLGNIKKPEKEYGLFNQAQKLNMNAIAITDHGNMFGVLEFYQRAKEAGIKPIIGCEAYVAGKSRHDRLKRDSHHLILLVQNEVGYRNLSKLVTKAFFEGFYYKPRMDKEILRQHSEGIIATSACLAGEINQYILKGQMEEAHRVAKEYQEIFDGRFYIELQKNGLADQDKVNPLLVEIARDLDIPLVATNDVHYLTREDAEAQDVLMAIQMRKSVNDPNRLKHSVEEFYLKSADEMWALFENDWPEACENTVKIAEQCNFEMSLGTYHFPVIEAPENMTNDDYLAEFARKGLAERLKLVMERTPKEQREALRKQYEERLEYELGIIKSMGFSDYFLIVSDFINWAKDHDIPVGPGRGSAAGSLVAFSIRITDIDPIRHDLLFERFLNPERVSMPDIDVDFCEARREEVIEYVKKKYAVPDGEAVAQIITFGTLKAKAAIKDVGRAFDLSFAETNAIAKLIPNTIGIKLADAIKQEPRLQEFIDKDPKIAKVIDISQRLEGLNRHASIHAAGVVISDGRPLDEHLPLYRPPNTQDVVTQFDMKGVEKIGLIKFDFLGLKNLTLIKNCLDMIEENHGHKIDIINIPLDDDEVYELLSRGDTTGVFQLESSGIRDLMRRLKPSNFDDVIALVALYRPGPLNSGMTDSYVRRKHGEEKIDYTFPQLEPVLKSTYGVCIYQEQVMQIANVLANYSLGEADLLRRAMGKKKPEEMAAQRVRFFEGVKANNLDMKKATDIFNILEKFAEYGFNRSHSAAYGLIAYQTAWLKTHYPEEYMAALFTADANNTSKIINYITDCREHDIEVLPPDVNESQKSFAVVNGKIRFGLKGIKNVGEGAIDSIIEEREKEGPFKDFLDFCERVDLKKTNRRVCESLIKAGAFDFTGKSRAALFAVVEEAISFGHKRQEEKNSSQFSLFGGETVKLPPPSIPDLAEWTEKELLKNEKEVLGFYISGHPLDRYKSDLKRFTSNNIDEVLEKKSYDRKKKEVTIAGIIANKKELTTKAGQTMAFITLEDLTASIEVIVFADIFQKSRDLFDDDVPLLVRGTLEPKEDDSFSLIALEIRSLVNARAEKAKEIHFTLSSDELEQKLVKFEQLIQNHHGHCTTYFHIIIPEHSETVVKLPSQFDLEPTETLIEDLERLFGRNLSYFR